ncbi:MAG: DUF4258 domain-containing protein [Methanobrevibacter sp.]|nr:DUF4258 domain-containing protein [Methanobrevibacter sp.]
MKDYKIKEVVDKVSESLGYEIRESRHFQIRNVQRFTDLGMVYEALINEELVGILKQDYNKFLLFYEHKTLNSHDLAVVIAMGDDFINLITAFVNPKHRRVKI